MGYLTVNNIWNESRYKQEYNAADNVDYFVCINVTVDDRFIEEVNDRYKKEYPKNVIENFDKKTGTLTFAGEEIALSAKGKQTDAALLMSTLSQKDDTEWMHNDQIFEDWHFNIEDIKQAPKNKIYFAAKSINEKVAMKTQIDDFIEFITEKARINPRYDKVDE